ncbi:MAG: hypothetical protein PHX54_09115 [Lentimicrobiaceae bacterium]|nr:hypothetical protein [Lentimicrobiaceae bacterium]
MFKKILVIFLILASLEMFSFIFIPESVLKVLTLAGVIVIALVIVLQLIYSPAEHFVLNFKWEILLILVAVFTSMFMANSTYNQSFGTTLIAQRFMYYYLIYYMLHLIKIPEYELEKIILAFGVVYAAFYFIQFFAYPTRIFDVRISQERGSLRIFQAGLTYLIFAYFMMLNKLFKKFSLLHLAIILLLLSTVFLMATRQLIMSILLVSLINILLSKQIKSKVLIIILLAAAVIPVVIIAQDVIESMVLLTQKQSKNIHENIRVLAAGFFLTDFFPNNLAYITGNGADSSNSSYGIIIQSYKDIYGFYQSDIGIIGDFSKFGLFFLIGVTMILVKALKSKMTGKLPYIKYSFIMIIMLSFTGGGFFGNSSDTIVSICLILYIIDVKKFRNENKPDDSTTMETEPEDNLLVAEQSSEITTEPLV